MRIKFLSVIVSFLIVSVALSSCLDSDENYEFSSDATIHAFSIDTIHGITYSFSIDQLNRLIFNEDSLPLGSDTIIDRILIKTMDVTGWVTSGSPNDTVFVLNDSVNLLPAMNKSGNEGMKFKVHAADAVTVREYTLQVRVHREDPDSLVWKNMDEYGAIFSATPTIGSQRSVIMGKELFIYTSAATAYKTSTELGKYHWNRLSITGLPEDAKLTSVINFGDKLYMVTDGGHLYSSADGAAWEQVEGTADAIVALVACFPPNNLSNLPATLAGIQKNSAGELYFCTTTNGVEWITHEKVPEGFPSENIYSTPLTTANGVDKVVLVGMPLADDKETVPWFSMNGEGWASMATTSDTFCPGMSDPSIMYYGGKFYCIGGKMDAIYSSVAGLAWEKTEEKFLLPSDFEGKGSYSLTVDDNNFIWIIFGGNNTKNEVWRGRLNRLGFKQQ